jgi:hypothetical protein
LNLLPFPSLSSPWPSCSVPFAWSPFGHQNRGGKCHLQQSN